MVWECGVGKIGQEITNPSILKAQSGTILPMPSKLKCLACGEDIVGWGTPMVHPKGWHYVFCQNCGEANEVIDGTNIRTLRVIPKEDLKND